MDIQDKLLRWKELLKQESVDSKQIVINEIDETLTKSKRWNYRIIYNGLPKQIKERYIKSLKTYFKYYKGHLALHDNYYPMEIYDLKTNKLIATLNNYNDVVDFMKED